MNSAADLRLLSIFRAAWRGARLGEPKRAAAAGMAAAALLLSGCATVEFAIRVRPDFTQMPPDSDTLAWDGKTTAGPEVQRLP